MSAPPAAVVVRTQEWESKLKGKNVSSDDVKRLLLPEEHRVIRPGAIITRDFVEDRLNVYVNEAGECTHCTHG